MRNICFRGKQSVTGQKWEKGVKEGKDKDHFVSFPCREGNEQKNEPEVQKGFSIYNSVKLKKLQTFVQKDVFYNGVNQPIYGISSCCSIP